VITMPALVVVAVVLVEMTYPPQESAELAELEVPPQERRVLLEPLMVAQAVTAEALDLLVTGRQVMAVAAVVLVMAER
jgi:hypothetical protein